ncbi:Helicase SEN1 [Sesamum alatum]|uniref:Helicase SEN1 n=1 Tax=Sesamum alatum TaxID=300844 RepID=A0AAE1Y7U6_9LAMI|nr:Helicase SEN1 [Sesamum alatum]
MWDSLCFCRVSVGNSEQGLKKVAMEGSGSGTGRRSRLKDDFTDLVLSWSLQEIFDENLYRYQVEEIPQSFESVDQYLGSYVFPLLEETRAELASAMETVYKAPYAEVTSFKELKGDKLQYDVKVDHWRNRIIERGREPYRTLPGDVVLLSNLKPETVSDLQRVGWTFTFASVTHTVGDENGDNCTPSNFKVKTAKHVEVGDEQRSSLYVVFLMNMITNKRIWNALSMRRNLKIIEKVLCKNDSQGEENCEFCPLKCSSEMEEKFGSTLFSNLNDSQIEAILASLLKIQCNHKSSVELIWGPPGTGKTTTLSILLYTLLKMNVRTLICAPTNVAITELASRLIKLVRNSVEAEYGNNFLSCPLGDMLIFGNKDRLKVDSYIEEIFLDYRLERLSHCLVPLTGWKHCVATMLDFLEDCVSQYQIYMDNELIKEKESLEGEVQQSNKSFLEFARDRFAHIATPLRRCMSTFLTHLPRSCILEHNFQLIVQLMSFLDSMEKFLFEDSSMTSEDLESIFLEQQMTSSESFVDTSSLMYTRSQCLSILRSLQASLEKLKLPVGTNIASTTEFCFQKASLIFCTTSSSYKLHSTEVEPFKLLVIDEAAQVKECESTIALQIQYVRHAILVGDECQLPAMVNSKISEEAGFGRSLFERLGSLGHSKHLLNMQYRMHPLISCFPNSHFYQNQILDAPTVQSESYKRCFIQGRMFGPYSFIDIRGGREELDDVGRSRRNMVEVAVIVKLVQKLFKAWNHSKEKLSIGLISPYAAQVLAIRDKLQQTFQNHEKFKVQVKSIDGFQDGEEDIIIISTVRSNNGGSIGFLSSPQRTNVALTRARHCLWILGNERTLSRADSVWKALVNDAKQRKCFFTAEEDCDIGKTITDVKKELGELEDLLSGESILFKNSRWKVLFSDNFRKSFQTLKPSYVKKSVINLLLKLASGWRPKKINVDWTCESSSYVLKKFKVENYYAVCSIDIIKDSIYEQVFKVWDIFPMEETPKLLKRLDCIFAMYLDDFVNRCKEKLFEGNLEVPKSWSDSHDIIRFKDNVHSTKFSTDASACAIDCRSYVENSKVSESLLLMKFYSLSTGAVNHLLSDLEGREMDLPFEVTDEEREIIKFPRSSFIPGRSGTGKTTILTMKLYRMLQQYYIASQDSVAADNSVHISSQIGVGQYLGESRGTILRQLFVTVSPKLCYAVKKHVSQLKSFAGGNFFGNKKLIDVDDIDEMAEFKDIPDTFIGIQPEKYPLMITFHKFLMMLDGTLGNSYFERFRDARDSSRHEGRRSIALQTFIRKNEVTYDRFQSLYWPHFSEKLTKNLDPSRVYTEIMSHIKGGLQEGEACDSKRSRQHYVSLSDSRVSTLSAEKREVIYNIFEAYEKMKMVLGRREKGHISDVFSLCQNFRTHTGVLRLAQSVIDLICHFFPQSIDVLAPETSLIYGESPVVLDPGSDENSILTIFGHSRNAGGKWVGFGADQVILVRDDSARKEISNYIGDQALVLTIVECKGLEFQDVLLYNFFGSSPMSSQWRVVYEFLKDKDLLDANSPKSFPNFSQSRHNILCSELKQLYVAITRTRQRLWICENNEELSKPMLDYWKRLCLVQVRKIDDSLAEAMQRASSPEEWKSQGIKLFWEKNYEMAIMCFEKAGEETWERRAKASGLRATADRLCGSNIKESRIMLREAAEIFDSIGRADSAAECFCDLGEFERAGRIYSGMSELRKAGECFSLAGSYEIAAEVYAQGFFFEDCLSSCTKGNLFDLALHYIQYWKQKESWSSGTVAGFEEIDKICQEFLEKCALECYSKKDNASLMKFIRAFPTMESKRNFLKSLDCLEELLILEEESRNFNEAADIAKRLGDILREVDLLEKAEEFASASLLILSHVLSSSLWASGSQGWPLKSFPGKQELLTKAMSFAQRVSGTFHASICAEVKILSNEQKSLSELMQCHISSKQYESHVGEILSIKKLLDAHFQIKSAKYEREPELHNDPRLCIDRISKNQVSSGTLVYVWHLWKLHSLEIFECLDTLERLEFIKCEGTVRLCFSYFGVRLRHDLSVTCLLLNPNAAWVRHVDERFMLRHRNVVTLDARHFASAARKYWHQELLSVGLRVLEALHALYKCSLVNPLSKYYQSVYLTCIFDITKFVESNSLDIKKDDTRKLQNFLQLSTKYFEIVFPLTLGSLYQKI